MQRRSVVEITRHVVEPVSLSAAKGQLGLLPEQQDDDALILRLLGAARSLIEKRLGVSLAARRFRATFVPDGVNRLRLPAPPLLLDGTHTLEVTVSGVAVSSSDYVVDADSQPAEIRFTTMPSVDIDDGLVVNFWGGPAPGIRIDPGLESAILLYVAHLYRNREAVLTGTIAEILPAGVETLLAAHSVTGAW